MILFKIKIRNEVKLTVLLVLAFSAIALVERKQDQKKVSEINVMIHDEGNNYFLSKEEVHQLITADGSDFIIGNGYEDVSLKAIENRIKGSQYVHSTQAFKDLSGNLTIEVSLNKPIARIIRKDKPDSYLCESGKVISTSDKYTSRVLLISGDYMKDLNSGNIASDSLYSTVFQLVSHIHNDAFWRAQIAQLSIDRFGRIIIYPQVTRQYIEFGKAENVPSKFQRLKYFYTKILPYKGWNHYARVNVEYANQIICE